MRRHAILLFVLCSLLWQSLALATSALQVGLDAMGGAATVAQDHRDTTLADITLKAPGPQLAMSADEADGAVEHLLADGTGGQGACSPEAILPSSPGRVCAPPDLAETPGAPPLLAGLLRPPRSA